MLNQSPMTVLGHRTEASSARRILPYSGSLRENSPLPAARFNPINISASSPSAGRKILIDFQPPGGLSANPPFSPRLSLSPLPRRRKAAPQPSPFAAEEP